MPILDMKGITKRFPGVVANDNINFSIEQGEIHALLGENGAGKTTLMNILYGLYQPDEGDIFFRGKKVNIKSPTDSMKLGIGMVHQHFMLVSAFTVLENIILGLRSSKEPFLNVEDEKKKVMEISDKYGLKIDPSAKIWQISVGECQRVEIIKALYRGADLLILDEPTAVLTSSEVKELFNVLRSLKEDGNTIIFISHKLDQVLNISDRITVLRGGKLVSTVGKIGFNKKKLANLMIGRDVIFRLSKPPSEKGGVILEVKGLCAFSDKGIMALKNISFKLRQGEILGVLGVSGNGQLELAEVITGLRKVVNGDIWVNGKNVTNLPRKSIISKGVGYIPEERIRKGLIMDFTVSENLILEDHSHFPLSKYNLLSEKEVRSFSEKLVSEYSIKTTSVNQLTKLLSGGNLQKLLLARELSRRPKILIAAQPTRGLDVAATEYVRKKILEQRKAGTAILLISEDLDEILMLSDRILVIYEGEVMGVLHSKDVKLEDVGLMMSGTKRMEVNS